MAGKTKKLQRKDMELFPLKISADVLTYWKRTGYRPTDFEKLSMVWNHWKCPLDKKLDILREYLKEHEEEEANPLVKDVQNRLAWEERNLQTFRDNEQGNCVYRIMYYEPADREYEDFCTVGDYETALSAIRLRKREHRILKERVFRKTPQKREESEVGCMGFDKKGRPIYCDVDGGLIDLDKSSFTDAYVYIPHSFKPFDVVRMLDDPHHLTGIVRFITTRRDKAKYAHIGIDNSDAVITLEWVDEEGAFCHDHVNPLRLEYCSEGAVDNVIASAVEVLKGKGYIQTFQRMVEERGGE